MVHDPRSDDHDDSQHDHADVDHPQVHDDDTPIVSLRVHDHYSGIFQHHRRTYHLYESCYHVNGGPLQHYDEYDLDNYDDSPRGHDDHDDPKGPAGPPGSAGVRAGAGWPSALDLLR